MTNNKRLGWWVHYKTDAQEGWVIGWLLTKSDTTTVITPHLVGDKPEANSEIMAFRAESIVAQGPVMLGTQVSREEYEASRRRAEGQDDVTGHAV
jgi:hypothetical protein